MNRESLFELWAPPASPWSCWAKPVLFAEMDAVIVAPAARMEVLPEVGIRTEAGTAVVVDLPGAASVQTGLALARNGYRPVPLFNGARGRLLGGPMSVVDVDPIVQWLVRGADLLPTFPLEHDAPPAFLLDAARQGSDAGPTPGRFDNRWVVFPQDFPSAGFLRSQGIAQVLLIHSRQGQPAPDLAHVLLRWQQARIEISGHVLGSGVGMQPLPVAKPSWFGALWQRAMAMAGLRRNSAGGFGSVIPMPSSSHGYG